MLVNRGRILAAAESGDRDAFLGLYDQFGPMLYRFCFWLTGNEDEARALVVAAFRRAYRAFPKRPRTMVLDTWFYRMAVRTFLASRRWQWLSRRPDGPVEVDERTLPWRQAAVALPPRLRVVWLLTLAEGMPQSQTAEAMGASLERVESLLERARAEFRPPDGDADRAAIERALRQLHAPRPGAGLRADVAAALGTGDTTTRTRVMQVGIALLALALTGSVLFSLLRVQEEDEAAPEQAAAEPKTILVLGVADTGALLAYDAVDLRPATVTGVGGEPRALGLSADGKTLYILQEDGLLTVDAQSQQVGRLMGLPEQDWSSLAIAGPYTVVGSATATSLMVTDQSDESAADVPLPWAVDRLLPLGETAILAVSIDRSQMARVELESRSVGETITIGAGLALGAVVPAADGASAYVTTPETEALWRVDLDTGQAVRVAALPAARAAHGILDADGAALYLSVETGPLPDEPVADRTQSSGGNVGATGFVSGFRSRLTSDGSSSNTSSSGGSSGGDAAGEEAAADEAGQIREPAALTMINTSDGSVERELWQGGGITQLALDPGRNILYALAPHAGAILVLDARTLHVRNVVPLAVRAVAFTLTADGAE